MEFHFLISSKMIIGVFVICLAGYGLSQPTIHKELTVEDRAKLFPMAGTKVPEYEIIPIYAQKIQKRSTNQKKHVQLNAFGKNIDLWLNPIEGILATAETPVYKLSKGYKMATDSKIMKKIIGQIYEDENHSTTININEVSDGNTELTGVIGSDNIFIHPFPEVFFKRFKRSLDNIPKPEIGNYTYHIIQKLPEVSEHIKELKAPLMSLRSKRAVPDTIYPEIMVVMDYPLFKLLDQNMNTAVTYIIAFWNGVDLLYRSLKNPNYRLNIAGIIIATRPRALRYMQYHFKYSPYDFLIDNALEASTTWMVGLKSHLGKLDFDVMLTMTSETFCIMNGNGCQRGTVGLAYVGGACSPIDRIKFGRRIVIGTTKSGIVHDKASYEGIHTAAHELAHLFGVNHDGEDHKKCNKSSGYLMSPTISFTEHSSDWSPCSLEDFQKFLREEPDCLYNKPKSGSAEVPRLLPGKFMDANEQCKRRKGTDAGRLDESICEVLWCTEPGDPTRMRSGPGAADGTTCGEKKMCLHGQCIDEH